MAVGNGVTSNAIKHRVNTHKKKGDLTATSNASPMTPKKSNGSAQKTPSSRVKKSSALKGTPSKQKRPTKVFDQDDSDADSMLSGDDDLVADAKDCTPKSTRARRSMSAAAKKIDYAKLNDPHDDEGSDDEDQSMKRKRDDGEDIEKEGPSKAPKLFEAADAETDGHVESVFGEQF